jgi:mannitol/fructose-specific phosphotransferase system IIA component (Ntr-type)
MSPAESPPANASVPIICHHPAEDVRNPIESCLRAAPSLSFSRSPPEYRLMAGHLSQYLDPARVTLNVQSTKRTAALNEVAHLLEGHPDVTNFQGFYDELLARERLDTTCVGNEVALPHARTEHVKKIVMAVGRSDQGVFFENSNQMVRLMFMLGTPKSNPGDYLQLVGLLCRILKHPAGREALMTAATPEIFVQAALDLETRVLGPARP